MADPPIVRVYVGEKDSNHTKVAFPTNEGSKVFLDELHRQQREAQRDGGLDFPSAVVDAHAVLREKKKKRKKKKTLDGGTATEVPFVEESEMLELLKQGCSLHFVV